VRIAIAGSHGTGKTTLAKMLAEALGLPLLTERAREAARQAGVSDLQVLLRDPEAAERFQSLVLRLQVEGEDHLGKFVSDRSVYDVLAYGVFYRIENSTWYRTAEEALRKHPRYDAVVYVPVRFLPAEDGFRFVCPGCQLCVDLALREILRMVGSHEQVIAVRGEVPGARLWEVVDTLYLAGLLSAKEYGRIVARSVNVVGRKG